MRAWADWASPERWHRADGAGNSFWLLDARGVCREVPEPLAAQATQVCERGPSPSSEPGAPWLARADGWLVLCDGTKGTAARMVIFNSDGSRPEACGNALRCVARFLQQSFPQESSWIVETDAGDRRVGVQAGDQAWADMGPIDFLPGTSSIRIGHETWTGWRVSVGNPHFVLRLNGVEDWRVPEVGAALSTHAAFPDGTNVEFPYADTKGVPDGLRLRVWERGVGETAACGTGACAAAFVHHFQHGACDPVEVRMPGGSLWVAKGSQGFTLAGPARVEPWLARKESFGLRR